MLRLDHVMGLHRLFWVPDGMDAADGVYVRYATEEQFAVVAIESHRAGCVVVGEDLGTVPDEVRDAMDRHRVLRSYVAEFAMPGGPGQPMGEPDHRMVATVDTHDTPTFAAFAAGDDLARPPRRRPARPRPRRPRAARPASAPSTAWSAALERGGYLDRPGDERSTAAGAGRAAGRQRVARRCWCRSTTCCGETEPAERARHAGRPTQLGAAPARPARPSWPPTPAVVALLRALQRRRLASHGRAVADRRRAGASA